MLSTVQRWWRTLGTEIRVDVARPLAFHGSEYGGWAVVPERLAADSVVLSFGIGEDITFDQALIDTYGVTVHAFDPTPKALRYVAPFEGPQLVVHPWGLGAADEQRTFHLPKNPDHVSGSVANARHVRSPGEAIEVPLRRLDTILAELALDRLDLLKMDIEGAEYEVFRDDATLARVAATRPQVLIEFHHRFDAYQRRDTRDIVGRLRGAGFAVAWVSPRGEEVLFVPVNGG